MKDFYVIKKSNGKYVAMTNAFSNTIECDSIEHSEINKFGDVESAIDFIESMKYEDAMVIRAQVRYKLSQAYPNDGACLKCDEYNCLCYAR